MDRAGVGKLLIGRGAVNQKGPEATWLAALHAFKAAGRKLPVNLVFVAEGEEEIGSPHFPLAAEAEAARPSVTVLSRCLPFKPFLAIVLSHYDAVAELYRGYDGTDKSRTKTAEVIRERFLVGTAVRLEPAARTD